MARLASRRRRQPSARRSMARPILWACVLIAGTTALYVGARSARPPINAAAIARPAPGAAVEQSLGASRGVQMLVPQDSESFLVATRLPDGRIALSHATGEEFAAGAHAGVSSDPQPPGKETRHDR